MKNINHHMPSTLKTLFASLLFDRLYCTNWLYIARKRKAVFIFVPLASSPAPASGRAIMYEYIS